MGEGAGVGCWWVLLRQAQDRLSSDAGMARWCGQTGAEQEDASIAGNACGAGTGGGGRDAPGDEECGIDSTQTITRSRRCVAGGVTGLGRCGRGPEAVDSISDRDGLEQRVVRNTRAAAMGCRACPWVVRKALTPTLAPWAREWEADGWGASLEWGCCGRTAGWGRGLDSGCGGRHDGGGGRASGGAAAGTGRQA